MTKVQNSKCDKTQKPQMSQNSECDKTQRPKIGQLKNQNVKIHKNPKCDKFQN